MGLRPARQHAPAFGKRTQLTREHFAEFEKAFGEDPLGGRRASRSARTRARKGGSASSRASGSRSATTVSTSPGSRTRATGDGEELGEPAVYARQAMAELEGAFEDLNGILAELGEDVEEVEG